MQIPLRPHAHRPCFRVPFFLFRSASRNHRSPFVEGAEVACLPSQIHRRIHVPVICQAVMNSNITADSGALGMAASLNLQIPLWSSETQLPPSEPQRIDDMHRCFPLSSQEAHGHSHMKRTFWCTFCTL